MLLLLFFIILLEIAFLCTLSCKNMLVKYSIAVKSSVGFFCKGSTEFLIA